MCVLLEWFHIIESKKKLNPNILEDSMSNYGDVHMLRTLGNRCLFISPFNIKQLQLPLTT